jgi:hypothetical protein
MCIASSSPLLLIPSAVLVCCSDSDDEAESELRAEGMEDKGELIQGLDTKRGKTTVRNLRIREDTAKYLRNLNPNSAHYDVRLSLPVSRCVEVSTELWCDVTTAQNAFDA